MLKLTQVLLLTPLLFHGAARAEDLFQIYQIAQQSDPQLKAAQAERLAILESKPQSQALLYPTISANANTTGNRLHITQPTSVSGENYFNSNGYTLNLTQPVYHRDTYVQLRQANARIAQADSRLAGAEQDLILRVSNRYFDVLAAQDNLEFARAEKKAIAREQEQSQQRFDVGLVAITDVQEAQARYDQATAQEIAAERQLTTSRELLREITGQDHAALAMLEEKIPFLTPEPADIEQWTQTALKQNQQLAVAQYAAEIAREEIERQRSGHYPSVDIVGTHAYSKSGGGRFGGSEIDDDAVGLLLNVPIYQGGLVTSRTREAEYRHSQAREILEQQQRAAVRQTRDSYTGVVANISRVNALKQAVISSKTALEATEAGLEVGTRTQVDVLDAQREVFRAERDHARARYDYIIETLRLKQAAGTLAPTDVEQINRWLK